MVAGWRMVSCLGSGSAPQLAEVIDMSCCAVPQVGWAACYMAIAVPTWQLQHSHNPELLHASLVAQMQMSTEVRARVFQSVSSCRYFASYPGPHKPFPRCFGFRAALSAAGAVPALFVGQAPPRANNDDDAFRETVTRPW